MKPTTELVEQLRAHGLKATPQRLAVFASLSDDEHPTADIIFERVRAQLPTVSQRTVYQALNDLVAAGEIRAVSVGTGATRFDPNISAHDHFVCKVCGRVYDVIVSRPELIDPDHNNGRNAGHDIDTIDVVLRGTCEVCRT